MRNTLSKRADLTLSSKRQVTLPAAMVRELGLEAGDKLVARLDDGAITLTPRPRSWLEYVTGPPLGVYGKTKEEVDAYIREVREGWDKRARIAEGDSYIEHEEELGCRGSTLVL